MAHHLGGGEIRAQKPLQLCDAKVRKKKLFRSCDLQDDIRREYGIYACLPRVVKARKKRLARAYGS
jgi:hypothetical protein